MGNKLTIISRFIADTNIGDTITIDDDKWVITDIFSHIVLAKTRDGRKTSFNLGDLVMFGAERSFPDSHNSVVIDL